MKKSLSGVWAALVALVAVGFANLLSGGGPNGPLRRQGGFVLLLRNYGGYTAGQTVELTASTEATLIANGGATTSAGPATAGALTTDQVAGAGAFAAGAGSCVITNARVNAQTKIWACLNQAGADGTALYVARIVPAAGSFTVYANANATAITGFDWAILDQGTLTSPT